MIITCIDLSKPRKMVKHYADNVFLDLKLRNIDVNRYAKISIGVAIPLVIGSLIIIPSVVHAESSPDLLYNYMYNNDILKCKTIDNEMTKVFSQIPHLNEICDSLHERLLKVSSIPNNILVNLFNKLH